MSVGSRVTWALKPCNRKNKCTFAIYLFIFVLLILFIIIYLNCKWAFASWQHYYKKTQQTNNTAHTTAQRGTLHKMHRMQMWLINVTILCKVWGLHNGRYSSYSILCSDSQKPQEALNPSVTEERYWALFYMPLYTFLHNLLNVPVQIANKVGLQKKIFWYVSTNSIGGKNPYQHSRGIYFLHLHWQICP
jgi:hypothetical protein